MSEAAKARVANQQKDSLGRFAKSPALPPKADVEFPSTFAGKPNPIAGIFYNPDAAFRANPENASRMLSDMAIYSALQERQTATTTLPYSIVPHDEDDEEQQMAAGYFENVFKQIPNLSDLFRSLHDATYFGRSAAYFDFEWVFPDRYRMLKPVKWTPVHGDSLLFGDKGELGYRIGVSQKPKNVIVSVEGRGELITPEDRECWVVHHYQKCAGEFRNVFSAAAIHGLGLRSRLAWIWQLKQELLANLAQAAEKFGSGWLVAYFEQGNAASYKAVTESMEKQEGSCTIAFPAKPVAKRRRM